MKWPLRYQIMLPMTLLMLATVLGLSTFHAYQAAAQQRAMTEDQIRSIVRTLADSSFPLTDNVLKQMKGLAGTEFALVDNAGRLQAATRRDWSATDLPRVEVLAGPADLRLTDSTRIAGHSYFHAAFRVEPRGISPPGGLLHIFYPEELFQQQRRDAILPTLAIGSLALLLMAAAAIVIAARVSRPLNRLREQVGRIAEGQFDPMPLPVNDDEIRELSVDVNRMATMLASYEATIRQTEQMRTLGQLGGAFAHQLRNSATGARMALDIHREECPHGDQSESLEVSTRQLILMEKYIQRFLSLGARRSRVLEQLNLVEVIEELLPLVGPAAKHVGVHLLTELPEEPITICGERDGLEHLTMNLLLNGIEAASEALASANRDDARVCIAVASAGSFVTLTVEDNGSGPPPDTELSLFESFVTSKPDGVGLGLAIAKQVVTDHHGNITWSRENGTTRFRVELPTSSQSMSSECAAKEGDRRVETARS